MHKSSSMLTQLYGVVISGGTVGFVRGVCGVMIASVVLTLMMTRFSMLHVNVPVGLVFVTLAMEVYVTGWSSRMCRRLGICNIGFEPR